MAVLSAARDNFGARTKAQMGTLYRGVGGAAAGAVAFAAGGFAAFSSSFVKVPLAVCIRSVQAGVYPNPLAAAGTTPFDVVKTRMMCTASQRPTIFSAARDVYKTSGPKGFYLGLGP